MRTDLDMALTLRGFPETSPLHANARDMYVKQFLQSKSIVCPCSSSSVSSVFFFRNKKNTHRRKKIPVGKNEK
jgi:hypothetical protein